jgi:hypothetical protein
MGDARSDFKGRTLLGVCIGGGHQGELRLRRQKKNASAA